MVIWRNRPLMLGLAFSCLAAASAQAQQSPTFEVGTRYWYSQGTDKFDLKDVAGTNMVSRLTWTGMTGNSGEIFARGTLGKGLFLKGYVGGGLLSNGSLQDEDFPPFVTPYSSTQSDAKGSLKYWSGDFGYNFVNSETTRLGAFVGYHHWSDTDEAYGCVQTGGHPAICVPSIPNSVLGITEDYTWDAVRLGLSTDYRSGAWSFQGEAAYARAKLDMEDTHWLRLNTTNGFTGATPTDGNSSGVQLEAILHYQLTEHFSLGVGARYWKYLEADGLTHFEQTAIPVGTFMSQHSVVSSERRGVLLDATYKF